MSQSTNFSEQSGDKVVSYLTNQSLLPELFNHQTTVITMTYQQKKNKVYLNCESDDDYSDLQVSVLAALGIALVQQENIVPLKMVVVQNDVYKCVVGCKVKDVYRVAITFPEKCVLCDDPIDGYGNNAAPLKDGDCCDDCNQTKVLPARATLLGVVKKVLEEE